MAFTQQELDHVNQVLGAFVQRRQPPKDIQHELRLELEVDVKAQSASIWTIRPGWRDPSVQIKSGVARFRLNRSQDLWALDWQRADQRWHPWDPAENTGTLTELVGVVDADRRGGFWG